MEVKSLRHPAARQPSRARDHQGSPPPGKVPPPDRRGIVGNAKGHPRARARRLEREKSSPSETVLSADWRTRGEGLEGGRLEVRQWECGEVAQEAV
jgi:hypothetical protein